MALISSALKVGYQRMLTQGIGQKMTYHDSAAQDEDLAADWHR